MKCTLTIIAVALAFARVASATVTVGNVAFTQDEATHDVTVTYDLSTGDGEPAFVSLDVLTNGVSVGATRVKKVSGDVSTAIGEAVSPGTGKSIIWKARADLPGVGLDNAKVRVTAIATNHYEGLYLVVDLSRGTDSTYWPVQYTACKPDTTSPAFYTTELWLRRVPAGTFAMGYGNSGDPAPVHNVTLSRDFYCGVLPVTRAQHAIIKGAWPNGEDASMGRYPVSKVQYNTIRGQNWPNNNKTQSGQVVTLLRSKTELQFDLPTEAQWEYACRAGHSGNLYNDGSAYGDDNAAKAGRGYAPLGWGQANSGWSSSSTSDHWKPVALLKPSDWDFYDFYGNVLEWCRDWYGAYSADDQTDPPGAASGTLRVSRGGSYALNASALNSYYRRHNGTTNLPTNSDNNTGYRLVVETEEGDAAMTATGADRGSAHSAAGYLETRFGDTVALARTDRVDSIIDTLTDLALVFIVR